MKSKYLIVLSSLLFLSACTKTVIPKQELFPKIPEPIDIAFADPHGVVNESYDLKYWVSNNFSANYMEPIVETIDGVQIDIGSQVFDGLKNQQVEDIINQKIADKLQSMKAYAKFENLPVYPGFYVAYPEKYRTIKSISIWFSEEFNANNILSLKFSTYVTFNHVKPTDTWDFVIWDSLNLDLNTGNELTLSDLFINGSDYQTALNDYIRLKSQNQTDPVQDDLIYYVDTYQYVGGFNKIRGDVKFYLDDGKVNLIFNENYPEFINDFSTVMIGVPFSELKDILAFGQRFMLSSNSLFTDSSMIKRRSYLYPSRMDISNETINGLPVTLQITTDDTLSDFYKTLKNKILAQDRIIISQFNDPAIKGIYYKFSAYPDGPYMNVSSSMFWDKVVHAESSTYQTDGTKMTLDDVFVDGFDYKSYIKNMIAQIIEYSEYQNTYDLDEVYNSLVSSLQLHSYQGNCQIDLTNKFFNDFSQNEGDFIISISISQHPELFKIKPWVGQEY